MSERNGPALALTRHPLQRTGAWAVALLAGRGAPDDVDEADLDRVAGRLVEDVVSAAVASKESPAYDWWKVLFALYPNSPATHSKRLRERAGLEAAMQETFAADAAVDGAWERPCTFCAAGTRAVWAKSLLPLFDTNKALNTLPPGVEGWPVCRGCRLAAWALPYGAWVTAGSATVLSCERRAGEREFVQRNLLRARRVAQLGFTGLRAGARPERSVVAALRALGGELPAGATLYTFKNDNQEPWLRVTRTQRSVPRFLARVEGNSQLWRGWRLFASALTRRDASGAVTVNGVDEAARLLFEPEDGRHRPLLRQLHALLVVDEKRRWSADAREALTRLAFDYAREVLDMGVERNEPVATLLADWIQHGSGNPRGRLAEYRSVALNDYKLSALLLKAQFRLTLDGRPVATGPEDWEPLLTRRSRAWEQQALLGARVLQLLQQRGVVMGEPGPDEQEGDETASARDADGPLFDHGDDIHDDDNEGM